MIFIDGENLAFRYQAMYEKGWVARTVDVTHIPDALIWSPIFTHVVGLHNVLRATYYTYAVGSDPHIDAIREKIKSLMFNKHRDSELPNWLTPHVFKKDKQTARAKGVDIQLTVDVLNHVHEDHVDTVYLMSGDGGYKPLIEEVRRSGKQVYLSAFSDGLDESLVNIVDDFYCLDGTVFPKGPPKA